MEEYNGRAADSSVHGALFFVISNYHRMIVAPNLLNLIDNRRRLVKRSERFLLSPILRLDCVGE